MRKVPIKDLFEIIGGKPAPKGENPFSYIGTPFIKMKDLGKAHFSNNLVEIEQKVSEEIAKKINLELSRKGRFCYPEVVLWLLIIEPY